MNATDMTRAIRVEKFRDWVWGWTSYQTIMFKKLGKRSRFIHFLVDLLNASLAEGVCPDTLKIAMVIPLFRSAEVTKLANYRPISPLSPVSY